MYINIRIDLEIFFYIHAYVYAYIWNACDPLVAWPHCPRSLLQHWNAMTQKQPCAVHQHIYVAHLLSSISLLYIYIYIIDHFSIYPLYHSYCINIFCLFPCYLMVLNRNSIDSSMTMNHWLYSSWISYAKLVLAPNFSSMLELCRNRSKLVDWFQTK